MKELSRLPSFSQKNHQGLLKKASFLKTNNKKKALHHLIFTSCSSFKVSFSTNLTKQINNKFIYLNNNNKHEEKQEQKSSKNYFHYLLLSSVPLFSLYQYLTSDNQEEQFKIIQELSNLLNKDLKLWEKKLMNMELSNKEEEEEDNVVVEGGPFGLLPPISELPPTGTTTTIGNIRRNQIKSPKEEKYNQLYKEFEDLILEMKSKLNLLKSNFEMNGFSKEIETNQVKAINLMRLIISLNLNKSSLLSSCNENKLKLQNGLDELHFRSLEILLSLTRNDKEFNIYGNDGGKGEGNSKFKTFGEEAIQQICSSGLLGPIFNSIFYEESNAIKRKACKLMNSISGNEVSHNALIYRFDTIKMLAESNDTDQQLVAAFALAKMYCNDKCFTQLTSPQYVPFANLLQFMYENNYGNEDIKKLTAISLMIVRGKKNEKYFLKEEENKINRKEHISNVIKFGSMGALGILLQSNSFIGNTALLSKLPNWGLLTLLSGSVLYAEKIKLQNRPNYGLIHLGTVSALSLGLAFMSPLTSCFIALPYTLMYFFGGLALTNGKLYHQQHLSNSIFDISNFITLDELSLEQGIKKFRKNRD
ncbi:hypothetical protein ABK040_008384 [Willaertia magna]